MGKGKKKATAASTAASTATPRLPAGAQRLLLPASTSPPKGAPAAAPPAAAPAGDGWRLLVVDTQMLWTVLAIAVAVGFLWLVRSVLLPFLFVGVLTFLGAPVVARLEKRMPRAAASGVFVVGSGLFIVALLSLVVPPLVDDLTKLFKSFPSLWREAAAWALVRFGIELPTSIADLSSEASKELLEQLMPFAKGGGGIVKTGAVGVLKGLGSVAGFVGQLFLVPVLTFFVLTELQHVRDMLRPLIPSTPRGVIAHYAPLVEGTLGRLVRGQLFVAGIMVGIYAFGLSVSRVPLALGIAVLAGAAYLIPFASGAVCMVLAAAFSLLELKGGAGPPIVGAVITCIVVQLIEGYILTPRIVGEEAGLSPLAAVLAVLIGAAAAGFLGVVFALPAGAIIALILREESRRRGGLLVDTVGSEAHA